MNGSLARAMSLLTTYIVCFLIYATTPGGGRAARRVR